MRRIERHRIFTLLTAVAWVRGASFQRWFVVTHGDVG
jgi:hypothetical protein